MKRYIIVGKAASGKDWLRSEMVKKGYMPMRQHTTREKRESEKGDEYHFVSPRRYEELAAAGCFISSNFYRIGWYGITYGELKDSDVAILSPANVRDLIEKHPEIRNESTIVFLDMPADLRRKRLSVRYSGKPGDDNEKRMAADEEDFKDFTDWDIRFSDVEAINNFVNNLSPLVR